MGACAYGVRTTSGLSNPATDSTRSFGGETAIVGGGGGLQRADSVKGIAVACLPVEPAGYVRLGHVPPLLGQEHALLGQCLLYNPRMWPAEMTIESDHNADSASQQDSLLIGA